MDRFLSRMRPTETASVLDVGVTSLPSPLENALEHYYPWPHRLTAAGTEDCAFLEERHPGLRFVRVRRAGALPFEDGAFDLGFSNATLEHVGGRKEQALFVRELARVARRCFIATPNRWFPVELHTRLPFLHWLPAPAFRAVLRGLGLDFYSEEENLNLLSARELLALAPPRCKAALVRHRFLGLTSNLVLVLERA